MCNIEIVKTTWHRCPKFEDEPQEKGWYLCKVTDLVNHSEPYEWSEPYYSVYWFDKVWDCDGVVIAWAEIAECSFELE